MAKTSALIQQVADAASACEAKKAEDITILQLDKAAGGFTDYFVICSGSNPRQIQTISDEVEQRLEQSGVRPTHIEGYQQAEWVLLDYVDFVVHVFSHRARQFYNLERLWKSARLLTPADLKRPPASRARTAAARPARSGARAQSPSHRSGRKASRSRGRTESAKRSRVEQE